MAEDEEGKPTGEPGDGQIPAEEAEDPKMRMMETLAKKLADEVKVEEFGEPKTVNAVAAVSFHGDTVYCTDKGGTRLARAAVRAFAVHIGCILVSKLSTPEGILELLELKRG